MSTGGASPVSRCVGRVSGKPDSLLRSVIGLARVLPLSVAVGLLLAPAAEAQQRWITPRDVELACQAIHFDTTDTAANLHTLCASTLPRLSAWELSRESLPTLRSVISFAAAGNRMAAREPQDDANRQGTSGVQPVIVVAPQAGQAGSTTAPALTETAILLGITDFLIEQTEAEVQDWLLPKFYEQLCGSPDVEDTTAQTDLSIDVPLKTLFTNTCSVLASSAEFGLNTGARALHSAVRFDLRALPVSVLKIVSENEIALQYRWEDIGEIVTAAEVLMDVLSGVTRDPTAILNLILDRICQVEPGGTNESSALCETAPFIVSGMVEGRMPETDSEWLNLLRATLLNVCAPSVDTVRNLPCDDGRTTDSLPSVFDELSKVRVHVLAAQRAGQALQVLNASPVASPRDLLNRRIEGAAEMLGHVVGAVNVVLEDSMASHEAVITLSRSLVAFEAGDFAQGVGAAAALLGSMAPVPGDGRGLLVSKNAIRLLTFAAELSSATTADEVKDAISNLAQAAASRGNKRAEEHDWLLILQAYGGVQAGSERADDRWAGFGGLYLPVGFEITMPNEQLGLFVQVIDVGALASSRIIETDKGVGNSPELGFSQVVAPGAYFTWAVRNTPLSIGAGGSFIPNLRRDLDALPSGDKSLNTFRWGAFFAIDIGLFP